MCSILLARGVVTRMAWVNNEEREQSLWESVSDLMSQQLLKDEYRRSEPCFLAGSVAFFLLSFLPFS